MQLDINGRKISGSERTGRYGIKCKINVDRVWVSGAARRDDDMLRCLVTDNAALVNPTLPLKWCVVRVRMRNA